MFGIEFILFGFILVKSSRKGKNEYLTNGIWREDALLGLGIDWMGKCEFIR